MAAIGRLTVAAGFVVLWAAVPAPAAPFTPGNLVVVRVDGSDPTLFAPWYAYSDNAGQVTLVEFTTAPPDPETGDPTPAVQEIVMPSVASGNQRRFTLPPGCNRSGQLTLSANGLLLALGGFDGLVGTVEVVMTNAADVPRVIALVDATGHVNTAMGLTDCYHNGTKPIAEFRMVATDDG